jgi:co-chaperonin GroES (HSP10)
MIQAPFNKVIVNPKTKYIRHISDLMKRSSIQNGASVDPSDYVNIMGEIISVPSRISDNPSYAGFSLDNIQPGDVGIFSYKVIYDFVIKEGQQEPIYRNMIKVDGNEYFSCDIRNLFAVIRGEEIHMLNGYVMLTDFIKDMIILPSTVKNRKKTKSSAIMHIGNPKTNKQGINANQGDIVFYNPDKAQKYEINNKKFIILQQDKILGKEIKI